MKIEAESPIFRREASVLPDKNCLVFIRFNYSGRVKIRALANSAYIRLY